MGAVGGRPNNAYYFFGTYHDSYRFKYIETEKRKVRLCYLDPHLVRPKGMDFETDDAEFHCDHVRSMEIGDLDPSICFGYIIKSYSDLTYLIQCINQINRSVPESLKVVTLQNEPFS